MRLGSPRRPIPKLLPHRVLSMKANADVAPPRPWLLRAALAPLAVPQAQVHPRDAIIVLGAPVRNAAPLPTVVAARLAAAAVLWQAGAGTRVVVTGLREAETMAWHLVQAGVPESALLIEPAARTTAENASHCAALLAPYRARTTWIVSQAFHLRRACTLFAAAGLQPAGFVADAFAPRQSSLVKEWKWVVREYGAWVKYFAQRKIAAR